MRAGYRLVLILLALGMTTGPFTTLNALAQQLAVRPDESPDAKPPAPERAAEPSDAKDKDAATSPTKAVDAAKRLTRVPAQTTKRKTENPRAQLQTRPRKRRPQNALRNVARRQPNDAAKRARKPVPRAVTKAAKKVRPRAKKRKWCGCSSCPASMQISWNRQAWMPPAC
jgi:hypothetical protein